MELLRADNLRKDFGGLRVLEDLSLVVHAGERVAIIGPNGAGKSTLFNILNGQLSPTAGKVYFEGRDITRKSVHWRAHQGLSRSFQILRLLPGLTVLENVLLAVQGTMTYRFSMLRPMFARKDLVSRAQELLTAMGLSGVQDSMVNSISYGEQRKLEIALSLAAKPRLLILDEPSCGLTTSESAEITRLVDALGRDVTVLLVAHDMDLVFDLSDRILVLYNGIFIAEGTKEEIAANERVNEIYIGTEETSWSC
jgi:ABC-type branched-subunit amino acid transport system ATPase component